MPRYSSRRRTTSTDTKCPQYSDRTVAPTVAVRRIAQRPDFRQLSTLSLSSARPPFRRYPPAKLSRDRCADYRLGGAWVKKLEFPALTATVSGSQVWSTGEIPRIIASPGYQWTPSRPTWSRLRSYCRNVGNGVRMAVPGNEPVRPPDRRARKDSRNPAGENRKRLRAPRFPSCRDGFSFSVEAAALLP